MSDPDDLCEACARRAATRALDAEEGAPYRLCAPCADRLRLHALRPLEWWRLAARHGYWREALACETEDADDPDAYYDARGVALRPDTAEPVERTPPIPTLAALEGDLDGVIGQTLALGVGPAEAAALRAHPVGALLAALEALDGRRDPMFRTHALRIAAEALGPAAADFVRARAPGPGAARALTDWTPAAAACLPSTEGVALAIRALDPGPAAPGGLAPSCLAPFRSPAVLDWIESHAPTAGVAGSWGRLAAHSRIDWARTTRWLERGRPLSLIALDALAHIATAEDAPLAPKDRLRLAGPPPSREAVVAALGAHAARDGALRPTEARQEILAHLDRLLGPRRG